jgi:hypothetical protein
MSEVNANIVVEQINLGLTADNNNINITPADIQLNVYTAGMGAQGAGGNVGELQFNNSGTLAGVPNTSVTSGNLRFTNIANLKINGGSSAYFLQTDGSGNLTWAAGTGNITGNASAAGANNQIQLSDGTGNFKAGSGFSFDTGSNILTIPGDTYASNFIGTFANGTSNIAIPTANSNVNITVNGNVSAIISDNKITTPSLIVNSSNVTIGNLAGANSQSVSGIAIGNSAGYDLQGANGIAIGTNAANLNQGTSAIAIGTNAGYQNQNTDAIAIGTNAGGANANGIGQFQGAIAIGSGAGALNQGAYSIALGYGAGNSQQPNNSIVINATGANLGIAQQQAFYVKPIRNGDSGNVLFYDDTTGEITYDVKPSTSEISNGTSNVSIPTANGNVVISVNGNSNIAVITGTGANINGDLTVSGNINGNVTGNITGNFSGIFANGTSNINIPTANGNITLSVGGQANRLIVTSSGANVTGTITSNTANTTNLNVSTQANIANLTITAGFGIALGNGASAVTSGVALGYNADATVANSTAIGYGAQSDGRGTSVGFLAGSLTGVGGATVDQTFIGAQSGQVGNANAYDTNTGVGAWASYKVDGSHTVAVGAYAGSGRYGNGTSGTGSGSYAIAVGASAGQVNQKAGAIAIGGLAGQENQGANSIAIGLQTGNNQSNNSITIDATGSGLSANIANALFVKPIRDVTSEPGFTVQLYYNPTTGEIGYK